MHNVKLFNCLLYRHCNKHNRGSGSFGSAAFALGRGRRVLLWLPSGSRPPAWSGVSWSSAGAFGSAGCWWLGVAVPVPAQLSLF